MTRQQVIRDWALAQVGSPYVYGATGQACTPGYRQQRMAQYPEHAAAIRQHCPVLRGDQSGCGGCRYAGKACYDCAQLTRRAMELIGLRLPSGASSQWLSSLWQSKGPIDQGAAGRLCLLFRAGGQDGPRPMQHVGLSLGDGRVVDARSHSRGVVLSQFKDYPWTHCATPRASGEALPLRLGDRGDRVRQLQSLLMQRGFTLPKHGADSIFGQETLSALQAYLKAEGLAMSDSADQALLSRLHQQPEDRLGAIERRLDALEAQMAGGGR